MKNTLDETNGRLDIAGENTVSLNIAIETIPNEIREKTETKNEETISGLWDNFKQPNINVISVS